MEPTEFSDVFKTLYPQPPKKVIIFCDPGKDDALMLVQLLAAHKQGRIEILGIVPGAGNMSLENTCINTLKILELTGQTNIPVWAGAHAATGKIPKHMDAAGAHGGTGLGEKENLPAPTIQIKGRDDRQNQGAGFAVTQISGSKEPITLVSTGGLTDVAEVLERLKANNPGGLKMIQAISIMGGVFNQKEANAGEALDGKPYTEFNFKWDPIATKKVFDISEEKNIKIILAPLDLTHQVLFSEKEVGLLRSSPSNEVTRVIANFMEDVGPWDVARFGGQFQPGHDLHSSMALLHPELYQATATGVTAEGYGDFEGKIEATTKAGNVFVLSMPPERRQQYFKTFKKDIGVPFGVERTGRMHQP